MLNKFVDVNQRMKSRDKEYNLFKIKVMEMFEQNQKEINELKGSLHRKQTRIDQLETSESIKDGELQKLKIQVQEMAIQVATADKNKQDVAENRVLISQNTNNIQSAMTEIRKIETNQLNI